MIAMYVINAALVLTNAFVVGYVLGLGARK